MSSIDDIAASQADGRRCYLFAFIQATRLVALIHQRVLARGGRMDICNTGSSAALLRMVENRAESWVYLKWHKDGCLFLEHWIISQQPWLSLSLWLSQWESEWCGPMSPHTTGFIKRAARKEQDQRWKDWERSSRKRKGKERGNQGPIVKEYLQRFRKFPWNHSNKKILQNHYWVKQYLLKFI